MVGTSITSSDNLVSIDDYSNFTLTEATKNNLARLISATSTGLVTLAPLICRGASVCKFISRCPIFIAEGAKGNYPLNKQCIVELNIARQKFNEYTAELNIEGEVDQNASLRAQISKLADFDVYEYRLKLLLAGADKEISDGTLLLEQTIAINEDEEEIKQLQEHPAWNILQKIQKQRLELMDAMGLTKKRQAMINSALGRKDHSNFVDRTIEILQLLNKIPGK